MSALAARTGALNLGQGFPDEPGPAQVLEAAHRAMADGVNQYPPGPGQAGLRAAIADHQRHWYGLDLDPETQVVVTAGATEALAAALLALVEPGDEVVCLSPTYDAYSAVVALAGGVLVPVRMRFPHWQPDPDDLRRAVNDRTRVILVNSPHNPTGAVLGSAVLELVVELSHRHDATIVTDEVYEHLVHEGRHVPVATLPGGSERTLSISSAGKTFSVTGWKVGWASGPAHLVTAVLSVKQYLSYSGGAPFQPAVAVGLALPDEVFAGLARTLTGKRDRLCAALLSAGFDVSVPEAGYFTVVDVARLGWRDAEEFCHRLPELAGVVAVPVSAFVQPEHRSEVASLVRCTFCKSDEVLDEAGRRLAALGCGSGALKGFRLGMRDGSTTGGGVD
ncbi:aminotransferase class I/II-fold pyridoxal phosphate-dependent enzyme [Aestuariimicrobium sp. T2.26MG-19.2B]|uniref:aminotransferase class I/II-fold pyridoxal phosphate-dependent enzyme n=1 Tax=Aestuariimicrobium sp. T2.26MG-19.2B TaxID=3040679 RepID=UPI0024773E97|nr:aminotransferase class I/II-fold pyridoxal phosphate-dependent enzyme [Aestuariimicrobium sp. T2.26MG-19.2B]CAI9407516.1 putative N-succinyldiaminopimelate aminotransferase DapC [Aestuariimicrobium sp. T2.26MG-19.2B]